MVTMANRKKLFIHALLCFLILSVYFNSLHNSSNVQDVFSVHAVSPAAIKNELITALFIDDIRSVSDNFYKDYFTDLPVIYNYEVNIQNVAKDAGTIQITFGITPMVGAHNPVGYDEATYQIDSSGKKTFIHFQHLKTYDYIPDNLKNIIKKPLPVTA